MKAVLRGAESSGYRTELICLGDLRINPLISASEFRASLSRARQRKRIAQKLGNPRLNQITFHTFRHWKATMEYHKTKDILYVMRLLGHKNIKNTLVYTQLVTFEDDDYVCKAATNVEEATELIETGYEYICEMEHVKLFRKRK